MLKLSKCPLNKWVHGWISERINMINPKNPISTSLSTKSKSELHDIIFYKKITFGILYYGNF